MEPLSLISSNKSSHCFTIMMVKQTLFLCELSTGALNSIITHLIMVGCSMAFEQGCLRKEEKPCDQYHPQKRTVRVVERLVSPLMSAILTLSAPSLAAPPVSFSQPISQGRALFQKACIGCHDMGGNILQPVSHCNSISIPQKNKLPWFFLFMSPFAPALFFQGATLFMKDLERNGVATEEGIYNITYYGKGRMPGFGERCTPKGQCTFGPRLQEDEIKLLAEFVKSQADRGWPNIESYGD